MSIITNTVTYNGKTIAEWQGPQAVSFINKVQNL